MSARVAPAAGSAARVWGWSARHPASAVSAAWPTPIERISHAYASVVRPCGARVSVVVKARATIRGRNAPGHEDRGGCRIRVGQGEQRQPREQEAARAGEELAGGCAGPGAVAVEEAAEEAAGGERGGKQTGQQVRVVAFGHGDRPHVHPADRDPDSHQRDEQGHEPAAEEAVRCLAPLP